MATNVIREGRNNMKRDDSNIVSEIYATAGDFEEVILPEEVVVLDSYLNVLKADSTSGATMDIVVAGTTVNDEVKVDTTGVNTGTQKFTYFKTGGLVEVKTGDTAGAGDGLQQLVLRYIELNKVTGEYTKVEA